MKRPFLLSCVAILSGCLSTSPPAVNSKYYAAQSEVMPESAEDIERMLQSEREPRLQDLLNERIAASSYDDQQISLGMPKKYVEMHLGSPAQVEVAGHPQHGNERWTYEADVLTPNGYITERRFIYFENHEVVGWEID